MANVNVNQATKTKDAMSVMITTMDFLIVQVCAIVQQFLVL